MGAAILFRASMPPAVFIDLGLETLGHPRRGAVVAAIAPRAWRSGAAACAGMRTFPRAVRVIFRDPTAILTHDAFHGLPSLKHPIRVSIKPAATQRHSPPKNTGHHLRLCRSALINFKIKTCDNSAQASPR
jgi:hypothetical protein